jgi:HEAT repeat protein
MTEPGTPDSRRLAMLKQSLNDADQSIRFNAGLDLAKLGDADSIPALIEGFQADSFITRLFHAGQALTVLGDAAVPALTDALNSDNETVRVDAAFTLCKIDPTRTHELLSVAIDALHNWNPDLSLEDQMRTPLIDAAIFVGEMGTAARVAIPVLCDMLSTPVRRDDSLAWSEDPRTILAFLMTQIADPPDEVVATLIEALDAEDDSLRWGAARALGELGRDGSKAIPALTSVLTDEQEVESIRVEATYSLAVIGDPVRETLPALTRAFESQDWWIRVFVVRILGEMGSPEENTPDTEEMFWLERAFFSPRYVRRVEQPETYIVPILVSALADSEYNVRRNATYALSLLNSRATDAIPALIEAMRSHDIGPVAAEAVAKVGEPAIPALLRALDDQHSLLSRHIAYALQLIDMSTAQKALNMTCKRGIKPLQPAPHHFYIQCPVSFDADKKAAFEALYQETIAREMGGQVDYTLAHPKHEFLRYLVEYKGLFMHGTDLPDLAVLQPLRDSVDTGDESGNVSGVYADKGYMRPIYFAVVHRGRCFGLHNGFFDLREDGTITYDEEEGFDRRYYKLTIGVTGLRRNPWRNGTVYALPPDTFEHWNEWTSRTPVRPVLRLAVTPGDLPLRDDVWGNDYRMFSYGAWVEPGKDTFPFLKDARATPIHPAGQPPWLRQLS